jgi:hypothetical protein
MFSQELKLLYRGSLHGFRAPNFHAKCDNISKTLTVVKAAKSGNIFGGYTEATWNQTFVGSFFKKDENAFLFSLVNKLKTPVKMNIAMGEEKFAIIGNRLFGPIFGRSMNSTSHDMLINLDSIDGHDSHSTIHSYLLPKYQQDSTEAKSLMTGFDFGFRIEEIEVFQLH